MFVCCLTRRPTVEQPRGYNPPEKSQWEYTVYREGTHTQKPGRARNNLVIYDHQKRFREPNKEKNELVKVMPIFPLLVPQPTEQRCGILPMFSSCAEIPQLYYLPPFYTTHNQKRISRRRLTNHKS